MKCIDVILLLVGSFACLCAGEEIPLPGGLEERIQISHSEPEVMEDGSPLVGLMEKLAISHSDPELADLREEEASLPGGLMEKVVISHSDPETVDIPEMIYESKAMEESSSLEKPSINPRTGCSVTIDNLGSPQPLYLVPSTSSFWPFSATGVMNFAVNQTVELFCTAAYSNPSGKSGSQIATCVSGTTFKIGTVQYDLTTVLCKSWPSFSARKTGATCNGGVVVETGFVVGTRFVRQLEICFNEQLEVTRYVHYTLEPGNDYYQSNVARPNFVTSPGFFGGKDVDNLYTQTVQLATIDGELGGVGATYIDPNSNYYLARGHMAAKADFVYGTQQRGTFLFLNAAPQWQVFNAGNWERIEDNVRDWVSATSRYVDVYTGAYGIATLPNVNGVQTPLYLYMDTNNNGLIPVPMLYFKVIIEPSTSKGLVLIGVNNPYLTLAQIQQSYIVCPDVSNMLTWLTWNKTNIQSGYSYACEVPAFASVNPNLPQFTVTSLLY